jgi:hypothetical protein
MEVANVALALGSSLTAGLNLYITVLTLGLLQRVDLLDLPPNLTVLANSWVLATAALLFLVEFAVDKIPYLDNTWDAVHSFVRVPAGAILAASALTDVPSHLLWMGALTGGLVSFTAHGAKASTRMALNTTPEPFTNWFMSLLEDGLSLLILWLISFHPYIALLLTMFLTAGFVLLIYVFYRFFKMLFRRREAIVQARF